MVAIRCNLHADLDRFQVFSQFFVVEIYHTSIAMGQNRQIWDHLKENVKSCVGHAGTHGRIENFAVREICRFVEFGLVANLLDIT